MPFAFCLLPWHTEPGHAHLGHEPHLRRDDAGHRRAVRRAGRPPGGAAACSATRSPAPRPDLSDASGHRRDEAGHLSALQDEPGRGAAGRGLDVPAARGGDRDRLGLVPAVRPHAGAGHGVAGVDVPRRGERRSTSSRACARDGSPRITKRTLRPHGNHNPQHGGQFFMAPDNWHHLEGTYPRAGSFRLFVYDDYARALNAAALRPDQRPRWWPKKRYDAATKKTTELRVFPLRRLEGRQPISRPIPATARWPSRLTAKVTLKKGEPEHRFDFTFAAATVDPTAPAPGLPERARGAPAGHAHARRPAAGSAARLRSWKRRRRRRSPSCRRPRRRRPRFRRSWRRSAPSTPRSAGWWRRATSPRCGCRRSRPRTWRWRSSRTSRTCSNDARAAAEPALFRLVQGAWRLDAVGDTGNRARSGAGLSALRRGAGRRRRRVQDQ